jgi:hypothetical protein
LQQKLNDLDALKIKPDLLLFERNGSRIFKMWTNKILKGGKSHNTRRRKKLLRLFKYYLLTVLFVISPIGSLFYIFVKLVIPKKIRNNILYFSQNSLRNEN